MNLKNNIVNFFSTKKSIDGTESINDLREKELSGNYLSEEELIALSNFEKYRLSILNSQKEEDNFHLHYRKLQVISNLGDWREFLKDEYFV